MTPSISPRRGAALAAALAAVLLSACAGSSVPGTPAATANAPASAATVQAHVDKARALAGTDLQALIRLCEPQPAERAQPGPRMDDNLRALIGRAAPPPAKVFDNLYYVGGFWSSAWLLDTREGFILIDALNNEDEARALIEGGMVRLGLDPRRIRYILITHGHGDHYGGATYLAGKYGARVVASEADWTMMHTRLEFSSAVWGPPPARDIAVNDGDRLTLGEATLRLSVTPGHTLGTLSPIFEVRDGPRRHQALLWGGTSFNFGKDLARLDAYQAGTERLRQMAAALPIELMVSNHASFDGAIPKMMALKSAAPGQPHPFVTGQAVVDRSLQIMGECARAQADRFRS